MRWPITDWRSEDRWLNLALKIGLVVGILAVEATVVASFAYVMWEVTHR